MARSLGWGSLGGKPGSPKQARTKARTKFHFFFLPSHTISLISSRVNLLERPSISGMVARGAVAGQLMIRRRCGGDAAASEAV